MGISAAKVGSDTVVRLPQHIRDLAEDRAVLILAAGDRRPRLRPDLTTVPIEGIDPIRVVLVTRAGDTNPLIGDLLNAAFRQ